MVLITLAIALSAMAYHSPFPVWQDTTECTTVWIFIPRSVFPIMAALPLSLPNLTALIEGIWNCGFSQTSQTVVCCPSICHGAMMVRELLNHH